MLTPSSSVCSESCVATPQAPVVLNSELTFYEQHSWCLNAFPTIEQLIAHLRGELQALEVCEKGWCRDELLTNVFLLSCAISDTVDDYLGGPRYDFSPAVAVFRPSRLIVGPVNRLVRLASNARSALLTELSQWRDRWEGAVARLAVELARGDESDGTAAGCSASVLSLLQQRLPAALASSRVRIPAAFRSQDLTHFDVFQLGRKLIGASPDRARPILVVGLRTAGSYFAPLLRGYLEQQEYQNVASVTLRAKRGVGTRERACLTRAAAQQALVAIIDEPVCSGTTLARGLDCLKKADLHPADFVALFPVHPSRRNWRAGIGGLALSGIRVLTLEPEEWHKQKMLETEAPRRLQEYLQANGRVTAEWKPSAAADGFTAGLANCLEPGLHWRLKRIYEIELRPDTGPVQRRFVLAKSVGWGWFGYHAFLASTRLAQFVPPVLGLRDGFLYMEWCPPSPGRSESPDHERLLDSAASYVATRARALRLLEDPTRDLTKAGRHRGTEELAGVLGGAYGWKIAAVLKRPRIQGQLANLICDVPSLIDGKMRPIEWIDGTGRLLKTDFEHHGMGKHELNLTDPAYDLADVILHWGLSEAEEHELVRRYVDRSGDKDVPARLFLHKLLAGTWAMNRSIENLKDPCILERHEEFNRCFLAAWNFLTVHTTRFCAGLCCRPARMLWSEPLVVLDVDGVLDRQIFGFPSTTAAGIEAVSQLASHGLTVALNTARPASELKEYCRAYGFLGGVAEYGALAWDAISGREQVLISAESLAQMDQLRTRLRKIPGVFVNDSCHYSVRAYVYARGSTVALPEALVRNIMETLKLDRLQLHQTYTDSTVTAAESDKGSGLQALLRLAGHPDLKTDVVGDSESDLPMFRVATRCFAPAQIACRQPARLLGCRIAIHPYQSGLLEVVRSLVHPDGGRCPKCRPFHPALHRPEELFLRLLRVADQNTLALMVRSLFDPTAIRTFLQ